MSKYVKKKEYKIEEIPVSLFEPGDKNGKAIFFYHGWGSNRSKQNFRAQILAFFGYTVLLIDGLYHGERGEIDYEDDCNQAKLLPLVLLKNLEEFDLIQESFSQDTGIPIEKTYIAGHSMGAMTAGAILSNKEKVAGAIAFNGIMDWNGMIENLEKDETEESVLENLKTANPMGKIDLLRDRPLCMLNGEDDQMVPPNLQKDFYEKALTFYENKDKIYFEIFPLTNHVVTTNMMEVAIQFLNKVS